MVESLSWLELEGLAPSGYPEGLELPEVPGSPFLAAYALSHFSRKLMIFSVPFTWATLAASD